MGYSYEIRTDRIPADYSEATRILYGSGNDLSYQNRESRFVDTRKNGRSAVKIDSGKNIPPLYLDDSNY